VTLGALHPFVLEKLPSTVGTPWKTALYLHVPSALLALPACLWLSFATTRHMHPRLHRFMGRATFALIALVVVPSGMVLAPFAQGGRLTALGFWLSGIITFGATLASVHYARNKRMRAHRRFALHVTAQLSVAVWSRLLLIGAESLELYDDLTYLASLWIPVLFAVVIVEWLQRSPHPRTKGKSHEGQAPAFPRPDTLRWQRPGRADV